MQAEFFENLTPVQQKGRRVPISLQEKVDTEIDKLLKQGQIEKLTECSDKYFCVPNSNNSKERWVRETSARVKGIK